MEENQEQSEAQKNTEEAVASDEITSKNLSPEEIEELKKKAEASSQNFERLKKAEADLKEAREKLKTSTSRPVETLSNKDILFLAKADVHEDDLDEVLEWSKFKKITVSEAHKQLKPSLDVKDEERKSANATQVRSGARGTSKVSGEDLLAKAERTGEVPDDQASMQAIFEARRAARFKK